MAKKKQSKGPDKKQIVEAFMEMARSHNIDKEKLHAIIWDTFATLVKKKYGPDVQFDIVVNLEKGDIEIYVIREIVEEVEDPTTQISLEEARLMDEEYEVGDEFVEEISLQELADVFGRRMIHLAQQILVSKIREVEREHIYQEFQQRLNDIILAEVYQVRRSDVLLLYNGVELRMPREEQIPGERYRKGESVRVLVKEVRRHGGGAPEIIVSRADNQFLAKLFELEIPEVYDGVIVIKAIAREPGERSKVAVYSHDPRIDPVGACVGMKGVRIHSIVRELNNENIDVIKWSDDPREFIARVLAPAKIKEVQVFPETRTAIVVVSEDQIPLAIGRGGQNIRLAVQLTGYEIQVVKEIGEDIELKEFVEELGIGLYEELEKLGITTAREFLAADPVMLLALPGMDKGFLLELRQIMLDEFDEQETEEMRERIEAITQEEIMAMREKLQAQSEAQAAENIAETEAGEAAAATSIAASEDGETEPTTTAESPAADTAEPLSVETNGEEEMDNAPAAKGTESPAPETASDETAVPAEKEAPIQQPEMAADQNSGAQLSSTSSEESANDTTTT